MRARGRVDVSIRIIRGVSMACCAHDVSIFEPCEQCRAETGVEPYTDEERVGMALSVIFGDR